MSRPALVLCPGRGSYTASELGYLARPVPQARRAALDAAIARIDEGRAARGDSTIRGLDGAERFSSDFFRGENASGLTFACTALDFLRLNDAAVDVVAVGGNSMGWYSALFAGGALGIDDTFTLIETMGAATRDGAIGAQVIYPLVDEQWLADTERRDHVERALAATTAAGTRAGWSIRYGGYAVLWADREGLEALLDALPEATVGSRKYPLTMPGHSAFHSPLMAEVSDGGLETLAGLGWTAPALPLIDGRGAQWRPLGCDPTALYRYTLATQVTETFDFSAQVRVALREYAPELIVLLGPGDTLGAAVAQVIIAERWQGIDSRSAFAARQQEDPLLISMARPEQAALVALPAAAEPPHGG